MSAVFAVGQLLGEGMSKISDRFKVLNFNVWLLTIATLPIFRIGPVLWKREDGTQPDKTQVSNLGGAQIKMGTWAIDVAHVPPPRFAPWIITDVNASAGEIYFHWENATMFGCTMTGVYADSEGKLIFPEPERNGVYAWLPNGTLFGEEGNCQDSTGVPIDGFWTTNITAQDRAAMKRRKLLEDMHINITENPHRVNKHIEWSTDLDPHPKGLPKGTPPGKRDEDELIVEDADMEVLLYKAFAEDEEYQALLVEAQQETMRQFGDMMIMMGK